ncbi:MAG: DUF4347 domain-containing protein [Cyanobacteria bacterium P01_F01_bin.86]
MQDNIFSKALSVLFIDRAVDNHIQLLAGVEPGIQVHLLDFAKDGVQQITRVLNTQYGENGAFAQLTGGGMR